MFYLINDSAIIITIEINKNSERQLLQKQFFQNRAGWSVYTTSLLLKRKSYISAKLKIKLLRNNRTETLNLKKSYLRDTSSTNSVFLFSVDIFLSRKKLLSCSSICQMLRKINMKLLGEVNTSVKS